MSEDEVERVCHQHASGRATSGTTRAGDSRCLDDCARRIGTRPRTGRRRRRRLSIDAGPDRTLAPGATQDRAAARPRDAGMPPSRAVRQARSSRCRAGCAGPSALLHRRGRGPACAGGRAMLGGRRAADCGNCGTRRSAAARVRVGRRAPVLARACARRAPDAQRRGCPAGQNRVLQRRVSASRPRRASRVRDARPERHVRDVAAAALLPRCTYGADPCTGEGVRAELELLACGMSACRPRGVSRIA
jgi:hypothetical protein